MKLQRKPARSPIEWARRRHAVPLTLLLIGAASAPLGARAEFDDATRTPAHDAADSARAGVFLPNTVAPRLGPAAAALVGFGGYDAAQRTGLMSMLGEVNVYGPFDLRLGLNYTPSVAPGVARAEPQIGARLRLLTQEQQGVDAAVLLNYRLDRYTADDGLVQAMFVLGRRFGRVGLLANLGYGQDPEGDDREGEAALAALVSLSEPLQIGLESHARFDLWSSDPRRAARNDAHAQITTGPTLHYGIGPVILLAQAGMSTLVGIHDTRVGAVALAGVGGSY